MKSTAIAAKSIFQDDTHVKIVERFLYQTALTDDAWW